MKVFKSIISVIIAVTLAIAAVLPALATTEATVRLIPSDYNISVGDTIVISVNYESSDSEMNSGKLPILYDSSLVEYVEDSAVFYGEGLFVAKAFPTGRLCNAFAYLESCGSDNCTIYTAEFVAVAEGNAKFEIYGKSYVQGEGSYSLTTESCDVKIGESAEDWCMAADLNGDGKISLGKDLNYFWEAYWHAQDEEFGFAIDCDIDDLCARADFNGDGKINLGADLNYFWICYWAYRDTI